MFTKSKENHRVLPCLGESLHAVWAYRNELFWLSFFSAFIIYIIHIVVPVLLVGDQVTFSQLLHKSTVEGPSHMAGIVKDSLSNFSFNIGSTGIVSLLSSYILAVFAVLSYRFFLKKEKPVSLFSGYCDMVKPLGVWVWMCLFSFLAVLAISVSGMIIASGRILGGTPMREFVGILGISASVFSFYVLFRFMFVSLCIAAGFGFDSFRASWRATKGHYWSLFMVMFALIVIHLLGTFSSTVVNYVFVFVNYFLSEEILYVSYLVEKVADVAIMFAMWLWTLAFMSKVWISWSK